MSAAVPKVRRLKAYPGVRLNLTTSKTGDVIMASAFIVKLHSEPGTKAQFAIVLRPPRNDKFQFDEDDVETHRAWMDSQKGGKMYYDLASVYLHAAVAYYRIVTKRNLFPNKQGMHPFLSDPFEFRVFVCMHEDVFHSKRTYLDPNTNEDIMIQFQEEDVRELDCYEIPIQDVSDGPVGMNFGGASVRVPIESNSTTLDAESVINIGKTVIGYHRRVERSDRRRIFVSLGPNNEQIVIPLFKKRTVNGEKQLVPIFDHVPVVYPSTVNFLFEEVGDEVAKTNNYSVRKAANASVGLFEIGWETYQPYVSELQEAYQMFMHVLYGHCTTKLN